MSGSTTELNLRTAVDSDDNADYLTLDLANSLRTVDALFNNVTGHNHGGAHQGGPLTIGVNQIADGSITSAKIADGAITSVDIGTGQVATANLADNSVTSVKLQPPIDIAGYFRSTNVPSFPNASTGLELYYQPGSGGVVQTYNRGSNSYQPLLAIGSTIDLRAGGTSALTVNADASTTVRGPMTFSTTGTINFEADGTIAITQDGNNLFLRTTAAGNTFVQHTDGSYAGILVNTVTASGTVSAPSVTFNQNGYYWTGVASVGVVETNGGIVTDTGLVYFHNNRTVYLQLNGTELNVMGFTQFRLKQGMTVDTGNISIAAGNLYVGDGATGVTLSLGGGNYGVFNKSTRPGASAGEVAVGNYLYVPGDVYAGLRMYAISFNQTSDPRLKAALTPMTDDNCMLRVRGALPVQTYSIANSDPDPDAPQPTPTDIGFSAPDVYANSPEFATLDDQGTPVGVNYANMSALLWGALRQLDARVQTLEAA